MNENDKELILTLNILRGNLRFYNTAINIVLFLMFFLIYYSIILDGSYILKIVLILSIISFIIAMYYLKRNLNSSTNKKINIIKENLKINLLNYHFKETHILYKNILIESENHNQNELNILKNKYDLVYVLITKAIKVAKDEYYLDKNVINLINLFHIDCEDYIEKINNNKKVDIENETKNFEKIYNDNKNTIDSFYLNNIM